MGNMLRGSCSTVVAVAMAEPWAAVQEATMQWMLGSMLRGSYSTVVAVAMVEPWVAVQEATMQWMLGSRPSINIGVPVRKD